MKKLLIAVLLVLVCTGNGWGSTVAFYDDSAGTWDTTTYSTIQGVFDGEDLAADDIIELRAASPGGTATFREMVTWGSNDDGISGHSVILRGRDGDAISIKGSDLVTGWAPYPQLNSAWSEVDTGTDLSIVDTQSDGTFSSHSGQCAIKIVEDDTTENYIVRDFGISSSSIHANLYVYIPTISSMPNNVWVKSFELRDSSDNLRYSINLKRVNDDVTVFCNMYGGPDSSGYDVLTGQDGVWARIEIDVYWETTGSGYNHIYLYSDPSDETPTEVSLDADGYTSNYTIQKMSIGGTDWQSGYSGNFTWYFDTANIEDKDGNDFFNDDFESNIWQKATFTGNANNVWINDQPCKVEAGGIGDLNYSNEFYLDDGGDILYIRYQNDLDNETVEVVERSYGITTGANDYISIENLDISQCRLANIYSAKSEYVTIKNCYISQTFLDGIRLIGDTADPIIGFKLEQSIISKCDEGVSCNHTEDSGIVGMEIKRNTFSGNYSHGINLGSKTHSGTVILGNTIENNMEKGIFSSDGMSSGVTVTANIFRTNGEEEIYITSTGALTHTDNCYYSSENSDLVSYNGTAYTVDNITSFESTAKKLDPYNTEKVTTSPFDASVIIPGGTIYAAYRDSVAEDTYIKKSTDNGQTWTTVKQWTDDDVEIRKIYLDDAGSYLYLFPYTNNANLNGIWRSSLADDTTWTRVEDWRVDHSLTAETIGVWGIDQDSSGNFYAGIYSTKNVTGYPFIYKSTDGLTWTKVFDGELCNTDLDHIHDIKVDTSSDYIYATIGDDSERIIRSTDNGTTWNQILPSIVQCTNIIITPTCRLFGSDSGETTIFRTTDDLTYETVFRVQPGGYYDVYCDIVAGDDLYFGTIARTGGDNHSILLHSDDDGLTWDIFRAVDCPNGASDGTKYSSNYNDNKFAFSIREDDVKNGVIISTDTNGWGKTIYCDGRCGTDGNGSTSSCSNGATGPANTLVTAMGEAANNDIIEVIADSGPYDERVNVAKTGLTWNFNGNTIDRQKDINSWVTAGTHKWVESEHVDHVGQYFVVELSGSDMITNGDMEVDAGWNCSSCDVNELVLTPVNGGSYSRHVKTTDTGNPILYQSLDMNSGTTYVIETNIYGTGSTLIIVDIFEAGEGGDDKTIYSSTPSAGWINIKSIFTPSQDVNNYYVRVRTTTDYEEFWVDDMSVYAITDAFSAFFDAGTEILSCVVDGKWWAASHSIGDSNPAPLADGNNWAWNDFDSLGQNTLYVYYNGGIDPTGSGIEVLAPDDTYIFNLGSGDTGQTINNGIFKCANTSLVYTAEAINVNNCEFWYVDSQALYFSASGTSLDGTNIIGNKFMDCGHRGIQVASNVSPNPINVYNNMFSGCHLMFLQNDTAATTTLNFYNNGSYNLMAGAIQFDVAAGATINEDYNQFHIQCDNHHSGKKLGFTVGTNRWATTGTHSFPPSQDTSLSCNDTTCPNVSTYCGIDPKFRNPDNNDFRLKPMSPCVNAGYEWPTNGSGEIYDLDGNLVWTDISDRAVGKWADGVDIGAYGFRHSRRGERGRR